MDAESVLDQARSGHAPSEWNIWPLRRDYVRISAFKWGLLGVAGFAMFVPVALLTIPSDFIGTGAGVQMFAVLLLTLVGAVAFGGAGIAIYDAWRLKHAHDFWLVITPETFVKSEPRGITQTPLEHVTNVTLKGVALPTTESSVDRAPVAPTFINARALGFMGASAGPNAPRQRTRGNTSLAYRDSRDNTVVTVCTDDTFDQMSAIYEILRDRAAAREAELRRTSYRMPDAFGRGND